MNKTLLIISICYISFSGFSQGSRKSFSDIKKWKYELEGVSQGVSGTYLIKVWIFSKRQNLDFDAVMKCAIHGIIFRGYSGSSSLMGQPPLTNNSNLEQEKEEFFNDFFADGGKYLKFINASNYEVGPGDRIKVGKEYKVGVVVSVKVSDLRSDLEKAQVIKSLNSGF